MGRFSTEILIERAVGEVWRELADVGGIYKWNPGVLNSHVTSDRQAGIGASRYCDLGRGNYLDESVVEWQEGEKLTMRITGTNLPFKTADIHFTLLEESGATLVRVSPEYRLKFGLIGEMLDLLYVRRAYARGMKALLAGLKRHIEAGR